MKVLRGYKTTEGEYIELFQDINDESLTEHPETGEKITRVFSPNGLKFKGSGFYTTDYAGKQGRIG